MIDALTQWLLWSWELVRTVGPIVAASLGLYWAWLLWRRLRSSTDPSLRRFSSSGVGSASVVVSGAYLSALLAVVIGGLLFVAGMFSLPVGAALLAVVGVHAVLEKREAMGGEPVMQDD